VIRLGRFFSLSEAAREGSRNSAGKNQFFHGISFLIFEVNK
jgi:hypothetical protein